MRKTIEVPAGSVAVHLDAEEIAVVLDALGPEFRRWNERQSGIEARRLEGWRHESAMCAARKDAVESVLEKVRGLNQYELPFDWKRRVAFPLAACLAFALLLAGCVSQLTPKQQRAERGFWTAIVEAFTRGAVQGAVNSLGDGKEVR